MEQVMEQDMEQVMEQDMEQVMEQDMSILCKNSTISSFS
jgi:hypothetical protein